MTKQSPLGTTFLTVAAVSVVAALSIGVVLGRPWSKTTTTTASTSSTTTFSKDEIAKPKAEQNEKRNSSSCHKKDSDESGVEVRDSWEETTQSATAKREAAEARTTTKTKGNNFATLAANERIDDAPNSNANAKSNHTPTPSTSSKTTTTKGKKWRDRVSAKKQLKLKQHKKHRDDHIIDSLQAELHEPLPGQLEGGE